MSEEEQKINEAFSNALIELKILHQEKLILIKRYRDAKNLEQLTKIRESFKNEQA